MEKSKLNKELIKLTEYYIQQYPNSWKSKIRSNEKYKELVEKIKNHE